VLESLDRPGQRPLRQSLQLVIVAILEGLGYRQMTLWFRIRGTIRFFAGERSWGEMKRKGLRRPEAAP